MRALGFRRGAGLIAFLSAPRPAEAGRPPWGSSKVAKPHLLESEAMLLSLVGGLIGLARLH